jgi:hypothetical protein
MDRWAWEQLAPWLSTRAALPVGALFCVLRGPTRGRPARQPPSVCSYATRPRRLESADGSLPTSSATPTPSRCHATGCPWSSSNASSDTPTSASPRSTSAASTTPKPSTPSTNDPRQ